MSENVCLLPWSQDLTGKNSIENFLSSDIAIKYIKHLNFDQYSPNS